MAIFKRTPFKPRDYDEPIARLLLGELAERLANLVDFLPIRALEPNFAGQDVQVAVLVDVRDRDAFGAELLFNDDLLPGDCRGFFVRSRDG